ncbi:MAG: hypothetical protein LBD04_02840 [Synergistaceae bacterium]|jgi:hypothetical protein|nr:hypothetical protein [Synergistaceae bacterium]
MANLGQRTEVFGGRNEILATYPGGISSVTVQVSDVGLTADEHGRKILPAGTIVGGINGSVFEDATRMVARGGAATLRTALPGGDNDVEFVAKTGGATTVAYVKPAPSAPLSVAVAGGNITVTLATNAPGDIVSTANDVKNAVNATGASAALVEAKNIQSDSGEGIVTEMPLTALTANANVPVADGVLYNDVDLTYGPRPGSMIIAGNINADKIPVLPTAAQKDAMKRLTFMSYQN